MDLRARLNSVQVHTFLIAARTNEVTSTEGTNQRKNILCMLSCGKAMHMLTICVRGECLGRSKTYYSNICKQ